MSIPAAAAGMFVVYRAWELRTYQRMDDASSLDDPRPPVIHKRAAKPSPVQPGMPAGSPGMEMPDGTMLPYTVELVGRGGSTTAFVEH